VKPLALVTGAPGWLGTRLVATLVNGMPEVPALAALEPRRVRCLILPGTPRAALAELPAGIELVEGDVRDPRSLIGFFRGAEGATLFHACGVVATPRVRDFHDVNVDGTRHVLAAATEGNVARMIGISSDTVVGWNRPGQVFDEQTPPHPHLHYGRSKRMMEDLLREAFAAGRLTTVIVRPCRFYGPGQPHARSRFYRLIRLGRLPIFDDGNLCWSWSYVDNICQVALLAERVERAAGETYWVADRRPYRVGEIVDTVERLLEREFGMTVSHRRLHVPAAVARVTALVELGLDRLGLRDERIHAVAHLGARVVCSIAKSERELGYAPTIELEEGLRRSIRWCVEHEHAL
jgi:nucleoside-diphosphate-sugar epimerase